MKKYYCNIKNRNDFMDILTHLIYIGAMNSGMFYSCMDYYDNIIISQVGLTIMKNSKYFGFSENNYWYEENGYERNEDIFRYQV